RQHVVHLRVPPTLEHPGPISLDLERILADDDLLQVPLDYRGIRGSRAEAGDARVGEDLDVPEDPLLLAATGVAHRTIAETKVEVDRLDVSDFHGATSLGEVRLGANGFGTRKSRNGTKHTKVSARWASSDLCALAAGRIRVVLAPNCSIAVR